MEYFGCDFSFTQWCQYHRLRRVYRGTIYLRAMQPERNAILTVTQGSTALQQPKRSGKHLHYGNSRSPLHFLTHPTFGPDRPRSPTPAYCRPLPRCIYARNNGSIWLILYRRMLQLFGHVLTHFGTRDATTGPDGPPYTNKRSGNDLSCNNTRNCITMVIAYATEPPTSSSTHGNPSVPRFL